jgi:GrpB-like predicted nucleotidyltransferase (UPF0157 family)
VEALVAAGLGLGYSDLRFERTTEAWLVAGADLRDHVAEALKDLTTNVEAIGSSSVPGLLAKPIIDLVVGLAPSASSTDVESRLEPTGWIYRGDAGSDGGHVFVLESQPRFRVAHLHVVQRDGIQWRDYLRLRDILRHSPEARRRYEVSR